MGRRAHLHERALPRGSRRDVLVADILVVLHSLETALLGGGLLELSGLAHDQRASEGDLLSYQRVDSGIGYDPELSQGFASSCVDGLPLRCDPEKRGDQRMSRLALLAPLALAPSIGCGEVQEFNRQIEETREALQKEIAETRKVAKATADAAIRAVPGERWLQLIDDLHSQNAEKVEAAQELVKRLARVDLDEAYAVSVWFGFEGPDTEIRADVFLAGSISRSHVEHLVADYALNQTRIPSALGPPLTDVELREYVKSGIRAALERLRGVPNELTIAGGKLSAWDNSMVPVFFPANVPAAEERSTRAIGDATETLAGVIFTMFTDPPRVEARERVLSAEWRPLDGNDYLFVVIPHDDYQRVRETLEVRAVLHPLKDSSSPLMVYSFHASEFDPALSHEPVETPVELEVGSSVVWAVHNMGEFNGINEGAVTRTREIREIVEKWEQEGLGGS